MYIWSIDGDEWASNESTTLAALVKDALTGTDDSVTHVHVAQLEHCDGQAPAVLTSAVADRVRIRGLADWQLRVILECEARYADLSKLDAFVESEEFSALAPQDKSLLLTQAELLDGLVEVLNERIARF